MRWYGAFRLGPVLLAFLIYGLASTCYAQVPQGTEHVSGSGFCVQCHDVHQAEGDYVLTREATVTAVCETCHGTFGASEPEDVTWSSPPTDFGGSNASTSTLLAYTVDMTSMSATEMDAVPGHTLGVMANDESVRVMDSIPGGSGSLRVTTSGQYGEYNQALYSGDSATTYSGTRGLYCASCHTAHGAMGQILPGPGMLSANPNHVETTATDTLSFCLSCHDRRSSLGPEANHPDSYCLICHADQPGGMDFPHTGTNLKLLASEPDELCLLCHTTGTLP